MRGKGRGMMVLLLVLGFDMDFSTSYCCLNIDNEARFGGMYNIPIVSVFVKNGKYQDFVFYYGYTSLGISIVNVLIIGISFSAFPSEPSTPIPVRCLFVCLCLSAVISL